MSFDINILGYVGLLIAAPAMFVAGRVAARSLLSVILPQGKVSITYTDINKNEYKTVIYPNKDEELLKLIDDIAAKNQRERKESASHV